LRQALAALAREANVPIALDAAVPESPITLTADAVCLRDALDLVLMQISPDGEVVFELGDDAILVRSR
jgi:hypothetical protein